MSGRIKPNISLWDKSFKETDTQYYNMTMQISLHGFYFTLFDTQKNKFLGLETYHFANLDNEEDIAVELDRIISNSSWLTADFNKVKVLYNNEYSTLVPAPLFNEEYKATFLEFNQPAAKEHLISFDRLNNTGSVSVYSIPGALNDIIKKFWPNATVSHFSSFFIECLALNFKNKLEKDTLFVNVNDGNYQVLNFKNNKLVFFNRFTYKTKEDFIYFLLAVIEQLGFNPENTMLVLMGNIEKGGSAFQMIHHKYD